MYFEKFDSNGKPVKHANSSLPTTPTGSQDDGVDNDDNKEKDKKDPKTGIKLSDLNRFQGID
jgi:hypothetical protein